MDEQKVHTTKIYAGFHWYLKSNELEKIWKGVIRRYYVPTSPNTRTANRYVLLTENSEFPIYTANVEEKIEEYENSYVIIHGKLVDLTVEGFGKELWIGTIRNTKENKNDFVDVG